MTTSDHQALLDIMLAAALEAGDIIMGVYQRPIDTTQKSDGSPVTLADELAEKAILRHLKSTNIPVLAEESAAAGHIPELGALFFVVDPLDGTKEFIKKNGEFTVNIALVEGDRPVLGVVTAPAMQEGYVGGPDGAFKFAIADGKAGALYPISVGGDEVIRVVASRSHGHAALEGLCSAMDVAENVSVGSSLKFCQIASGAANFYPRFTPTCEWDTAAGDAVLAAAGGSVLTLDGSNLTYGKTETRFLNPFFVAAESRGMAAKAAKNMQELLASDA